MGAEPVKTAQSTIKILEFQIYPRIWHTFSLKFRPFLTQVIEYETTPLQEAKNVSMHALAFLGLTRAPLGGGGGGGQILPPPLSNIRDNLRTT